MNKTAAIGFKNANFGGFAGVGKIVTSKGSARESSGFRETWNMVYTEPSIVAENHETRNLVTRQLKENFLANNDLDRFKAV